MAANTKDYQLSLVPSLWDISEEEKQFLDWIVD